METTVISVSVSNLDFFNWWRSQDDRDFASLVKSFRREEEDTPAMKAGTALHKWLESPEECDSIIIGDYRFDVNCDIVLDWCPVGELTVHKRYGNLLVRGRVDRPLGKTIIDYKTTERFDPDRLMTGYQWRLYLDLCECDKFIWHVFVMKEFGANEMRYAETPHCYSIYDSHKLIQLRYPGLHEDCLELAEEYLEFAEQTGLEEQCKAGKEPAKSSTDVPSSPSPARE